MFIRFFMLFRFTDSKIRYSVKENQAFETEKINEKGTEWTNQA